MPDLFLASTPLTALLAGAVAPDSPGSTLVLIEDFPDAARWQSVLCEWPASPFRAIKRIPGRYTETMSGAQGRLARELAKRGLRAAAFAALATLDREQQPQRVFVGNDRRPETQYALHLAADRRTQPGVYLDDGLFSYIGDLHDRPLSRRLDGVLKRRLYGRWWQSLAAAGTSAWIESAQLAFPARADPRITARRVALDPTRFATPAMRRLVRELWRTFAPAAARPRFDALLLLPHSRLWRERTRQRDAVSTLRDRLAAAHSSVGVKYHPREASADPLGLAARDVSLIPRGLAAELLLPRLGRGALVLGEASTALLAARWLRPDLRVVDLGWSDQPFARRASALLRELGAGKL